MSTITENNLQARKHFVSTYLQLIGLDDDKNPGDFNNISDYHKIKSLGPSLPKFDVRLPTWGQRETKSKKIAVKLKSIKAPRFSTELADVASSSTIYKIKQDVIEKESALKNAGVTPSDMKFLVKGKVFVDTTPLSSISQNGDEVSFMVVISEPSSKSGKPQTRQQTPSNASAVHTSNSGVVEPTVIQEKVWTDIYGILKQNLADSNKADEVLNSFKRSINQ